MLIDSLLKLAASQSLSDSDEVTTYSIDLGSVDVARRVGNGTPMSLVFVIKTAAAGDSGSLTDTFRFKAVEDTVAAMSGKTEIISRLVPGAELVAGRVIDVPLPVDKPTKRYLAGQADFGSGDTAAADCFLIPTSDVQAFVAYAKGYAI